MLSSRAVAPLALVLIAACQTWQPRTQSPTIVIQREQPDRVRLHSVEENSWIVLRGPQVSGDSIAGRIERIEVNRPTPRTRPEWASETQAPELVPVEIPAASVDFAEVRGTDAIGTGALIGLPIGAAVAVGVCAAVCGDVSFLLDDDAISKESLVALTAIGGGLVGAFVGSIVGAIVRTGSSTAEPAKPPLAPMVTVHSTGRFSVAMSLPLRR